MLGDKTAHNSLWAKTEIHGGYGLHTGPNGLSVLDEEVFMKPNMVTLGGVQMVMETLFKVKGPIVVPTLYSDTGIGIPDNNVSTEKSAIQVPEGVKYAPHDPGYGVVLFGVGITGAAEDSVTEIPVTYREKSINVNLTTADGTILNGHMVPYRYTEQNLSDSEKKVYFGKKSFDDGNTGYFLKRFQSDPVIHHLWKNGSDSTDETEVENSEVWSSNRTNGVTTLTEIVLQLSIKDIKEYFTITDSVKRTRINTLALFTANYNPTLGDYENVRMFSKLNIPTENLSLSKDMDFIYRVYGS